MVQFYKLWLVCIAGYLIHFSFNYQQGDRDNSTNPKRLYSYIKHRRNDQSGIQQLQDKDGFIRSDSITKANILNQHFQSVFTKNEDRHIHHSRQRR